LERAITPNTKAIMPVHLFGASADMDGIMNVARKRNIKVVEDACQSPYVEWDGTKLGLIGDCGAISFNVWKTLGCGDGGAIVARDKDVAIAADAYRDNGRARNGGDRAYMGMNYRPTEMQAALLTSQLERYKKQAPLRDKNAKYLTKGLQDIAGLYPLKVYSKISNHNWYNYMIRYDADEMGGLSIGKFARAMDAEGMRMGAHDEGHIMAQDGNLTRMLKGRHFKRIYTSRQIQHCEDSRKCPHAKHLAANMLQVNQYVLLGSQKDMDGILEAVDKVRKNAGALAKA